MNLRFLNVGIWNANGLRRQASEFRDFVYSNNLDIILVSETHFSQGNIVKVANYQLFNVDRPGTSNFSSGGTAVYIKHGLNATLAKIPTLTGLEATPIVVDLPHTPHLLIAAIYAPPNYQVTRLLEQNLTDLTRPFSNFIIAGDFNAQHHSWSCRRSSLAGIKVRRWADQNHAQILAPLEPTRPITNSIIDFAITRNFPFPSTIQTVNDLSSDHLPVVLTFDLGNYSLDMPTMFSVNWDDFTLALSRMKTPPTALNSASEVAASIKAYEESLHSAFREVAKPRQKTQDVFKLPEHIRDLKRQRNRCRRDWQTSRDPLLKVELNRLNRCVKAAITEFSTERYNTYVESLTTTDNTIWTAASRMRRTRTHIPALQGPNGMAYSNTQKAELIADSLRSQFSLNPDVKNPRMIDIVDSTVDQFLNTTHNNTLKHTDPFEVATYLGKLKKNKAPGLDRISSNMLMHLPVNFFLYLVILINSMLDLSIFPDCWKMALVVPIPKPGQDRHAPSSFRPISLLSCLSKVYEFVLVNRLNEVITSSSFLIDEQFGFRRSLSTTHQIWRVTELINEGFLYRKKTGAVFLDIAKAFDRVWHKGLLYKLIKLNAPPQLIKIFNDYLKDRLFSVKVNNTISTSRVIEAGVPQGSNAGPLLFNIYINDIPKVDGVNLSLYADDTAILYSHITPHKIIDKLQSYMDTLHIWLRKWRIKVNANKSAAMIFSKKPISPDTNISLNNDVIPWVNSYKYLGIHLDSKLIWHLQVTETVQKARKASMSLKSLLAKNSRLSLSNKLLLYKSYIRSTMTYGSVVWGSVCETQMQKLQTFQNTLLRRFVRATVFVRNDVIHSDLRVQPIFQVIKKLARKFHRDRVNIPNAALRSIKSYSINSTFANKRPLAILSRDDGFAPPSKRRRREPP